MLTLLFLYYILYVHAGAGYIENILYQLILITTECKLKIRTGNIVYNYGITLCIFHLFIEYSISASTSQN